MDNRAPFSSAKNVQLHRSFQAVFAEFVLPQQLECKKPAKLLTLLNLAGKRQIGVWLHG